MGGLWRGQFTIRRAAALAAHLPAGSQSWRWHDYDQAWTLQEHFTATVADRLRNNDETPTIPRPSDSRERTRYEDISESKAEQWIKNREREAAERDQLEE